MLNYNLKGDDFTPLFEAGMNSLQSVRFYATLKAQTKAMEMKFSSTIVFDYPSIGQMAGHIFNLMDVDASEVKSSEITKTAVKKIEEGTNAIVSMACRLPSGCDTPDKFWDFLLKGESSISRIPVHRWNTKTAYPAGVKTAEYASFLNDVDMFDHKSFGLSSGEVSVLDPQQRLALEVAYECLAQSSIVGDNPTRPGVGKYHGARVGVYIAYSNDDWRAVLNEGHGDGSSYGFSGRCGAIAAGRISYTFGLKGPSMVVNTACSSSIVAVDLASKALRDDECDAALVIAVNLNLHPQTFAELAQAGQLSPLGRCATFDAASDGFVRGEGVVGIMMERSEDALSLGDDVLAEILGSGVNQG